MEAKLTAAPHEGQAATLFAEMSAALREADRLRQENQLLVAEVGHLRRVILQAVATLDRWPITMMFVNHTVAIEALRKEALP